MPPIFLTNFCTLIRLQHHMDIQEFFSKPVVVFGVHVFLLLGVFVNIYQLYRLDRIEKEVSTKEFSLDTLRQQNEDSRNQKDYFNSDIFKEKFAKEEGFKKRGEEVIDTTLIESENSESSSYIPQEVETQKTNPILWWEFLFSNE